MSGIAQPPTSGEKRTDRIFRGLTWFFAFFVVAGVLIIAAEIFLQALPAIGEYGVGFLGEDSWDPQREKYGIRAQLLGTLYSSILGLTIGGVLGLAVAIFLSQDFLPPTVEKVLKNIVELLAAIPSVVYGLWGLFVVGPALQPISAWCHEHFSGIPLFATQLNGPVGMLPASIVLAIMVLPTISALARDSLAAVPNKIREASYGLGATRWETILSVVIPTAASGIFGAIVLGFGRAVGETMALAMLVGNSNEISWSLFSPGTTLAALLANSFPEAGRVEVAALMYAALVLLLVTLLTNFFGTAIMNRASRHLKGLN